MAVPALEPRSPINRINVVLGLIARLLFDRSFSSFTPLEVPVSPFFVTVPVPGRNKGTFVSFPPSWLALYPNNAPLPPQLDMSICDLSPLFPPGLREPDKPRFVRAHRTDRPANRPEFLCTKAFAQKDL
jgi:hypothetical protein